MGLENRGPHTSGIYPMRMLKRYQNPPQKSKGIISGALLQTFEEAGSVLGAYGPDTLNPLGFWVWGVQGLGASRLLIFKGVHIKKGQDNDGEPNGQEHEKFNGNWDDIVGLRVFYCLEYVLNFWGVHIKVRSLSIFRVGFGFSFRSTVWSFGFRIKVVP